jgi:GNAT superfamily N-acetyltransferase
MSSSDFGGDRPAVLRCGRCGRIADWNDARVQVVCDCRPRLELPPPLVREASQTDRARAVEIFEREFRGRQLVADGVPVSFNDAEMLVAETEGGINGALAWRRRDGFLHIVALATDPMWQRAGLGGYLLAEAEALARRDGLPRVLVTMTNDNIPGLYFYQRRGYRLSAVLSGAVSSQPQNKDVAGFAGIRIEDELQLSKQLEISNPNSPAPNPNPSS